MQLPVWLHLWVAGCALAAGGIYGLAYMYFNPGRKLSDVMTNKQYRWALSSLAVGGALLAIADLFFIH